MLSIVDPLFADYAYAVPAGWLCLVASLFFLSKRPAANAFLNLSLVGIGGAPLIAGVSYGRFAGIVGVLSVLVLLLRRRRPGAVPLPAIARSPMAWLAGVCLLISVKILIETVVYGANFARTQHLTSGLIEVLFPVTILLLAVMRDGPEATQRNLIIGMVTFPVLVFVGYLPFVIKEGLLLSAVDGSRLFTLGVVDTINTARVFTYGAVASLLSLNLRSKHARIPTFVAYGTALGFAMLILLTGNRQFLLAILTFVLLHALLLQRSSNLRWIASTVVLASLTLAVYDFFVVSNDLAIKSRASIEALQIEAVSSRGAIWSDAFETIREHPWLGAGFKNFGTDVLTYDTSGRIVTLRDSAHGLLQDVATEHGLPLGVAFLAGFVQLVVRSWRTVREERGTSPGKAWIVGLHALLLPLLFSSGFLNATPAYLLLLTTMTRDGQHVKEEWSYRLKSRHRALNQSMVHGDLQRRA